MRFDEVGTLPGSPSPSVTAMDARNDQYKRAKQRGRASSVISDAFVAGIGESILPVMRKRERAALLNIWPPGLLGNLGSFPPLPRPLSFLPKVSRSFHAFERVETARSAPLATHLPILHQPVLYAVLALKRQESRASTAMERPTSLHTVQKSGEESSPRFCTVFPRSSGPPSAPGAEMRGEGHALPFVHRRVRRRWTALTGPRRVQNDGGECLPPFCTLRILKLADPPVVGCDAGRGEPPPRVSIAGRDGDGRLEPLN